jgi:hypothetical protein
MNFSDNLHIVHLQQAHPPYELLASPFTDEASPRTALPPRASSAVARVTTAIQTRKGKYNPRNSDDSSDDEPSQLTHRSIYESSSDAFSNVHSMTSGNQSSVNETTKHASTEKTPSIRKSRTGESSL